MPFPRPVNLPILLCLWVSTWGLVIIPKSVHAQDEALRLSLELAKTPEDSLRLILDLADNLSDNRPEEVENYGLEAILLANQLSDMGSMIRAYHILGKAEVALGNYTQALQAYQTALNEAQTLANKAQVANSLAYIADLYYVMKKYESALDKAKEGLKIGQEVQDLASMAANYRILAAVYQYLDKPNEALDYYQKAIVIFDDLDLSEDKAATLKSIGDIYLDGHDYDRAINFYKRALEIVEATNKLSQTRVLIRLAEARLLKSQFAQARDHLDKALKLSFALNSRSEQSQCMLGLSRYFESVQRYDSALFYYKTYMTIKERLVNTDRNVEIERQQKLFTQQRADKLRKDYDQLKTEQEQNKKIIRRDQEVIFLSVVMLVLMIFTIILFYRGNQKHKRDKKLLVKKNDEIEKQRDEILKQQDVIQDNAEALKRQNEKISKSMESAKMIQNAMLPSPEKFQIHFQDFFIMYYPKDIVSGDFYWLEQINGITFIAAADCTGHGAPGAFMSMIGHALLDKIILLQRIFDPAEILNALREEVRGALNQEETLGINGMDMLLLAIKPGENGHTNVAFAGAKRHLFYFKKGSQELEKVKGDNIAIGGNRNTAKRFVTHHLSLERGGYLYLTSDGYTDQNGPDRKKIGNMRFQQLLEENASLSLAEQHDALDDFLKSHQQGEPQRDDIMVIGLQL